MAYDRKVIDNNDLDGVVDDEDDDEDGMFALDVTFHEDVVVLDPSFPWWLLLLHWCVSIWFLLVLSP